MDEPVISEATHQLAAMMVETVDQLRDGLSAVGLDGLAAKLSEPFWSMSRNDQVALLAEVSAQLQSRVPGGCRGTSTAAAGVAFDRTPWIAFSGETKAVEDWLSLPLVVPPFQRFESPRTDGGPTP